MSDDFHNNNPIKATKRAHQCEQCGEAIAIGSPAVNGSGKYDGYFYSHHTHVECHEAGIAYAKLNHLWGEEFPWFQHMYEGDDHHGWLLENYPIVASRLGIASEVGE